ncbi:MAG: caspase family protein [Armatimonadetes bacterium]|nr:caspase family protein [Armatimonadota bacterium]
MRIAQSVLARLHRPALALCGSVILVALTATSLPATNPVSRDLATEPTKIAILIGVSYKLCEGNPKMLHTAQDVEALKVVLEKERFGFQVFTFVTPEETTKDAILNGIRDIAKKHVKPGGVLFIHFSGHGKQVRDESGDEAIDGKDEAFVPSDVWQDGVKKRYILDDDIAVLLKELEQFQTLQTLLTFDSCFSGSMMRGGPLARGDIDQESAGDAIVDTSFLLDEMSGAIVMSAARSNERAYELRNEKIGAFTFALASALESSAGPDTTIEEILGKVRRVLMSKGHTQEPQVEGDRTRIIFAGGTKQRPTSWPAGLNGNTVLLRAGTVHGITVGSVLLGCQLGTFSPNDDDEAVIGKFEVTKAGMLESELEPLDKGIFDSIPKKFVTFMYERSVATDQTRVYSDIEELRLALSQRLDDKRFAVTADDLIADLSIVPASEQGSGRVSLARFGAVIPLIQADKSYVTSVDPNTDEGIGILTDAINRFRLAQRFAVLENPEETRLVSLLRVTPCAVEYRTLEYDVSGGETKEGRFLCYVADLPRQSGNADKAVVMEPGSYFTIRVKNLSPRETYYHILSIDPAFSTHVLWPPRNQSNEPAQPLDELAIKDDLVGWKQFMVNREVRGTVVGKVALYKVGEAGGNETIKVILATRDIGIHGAIAGTGPRRGDALSSLLQDALPGTQRTSPLRGWGATEMTFVVGKKRPAD